MLVKILLCHVFFNSIPVCGGLEHSDGCRMWVSICLFLLRRHWTVSKHPPSPSKLPASLFLHPSHPSLSLSFWPRVLVSFKSTPVFSLFLIFHVLCISISGPFSPHPVRIMHPFLPPCCLFCAVKDVPLLLRLKARMFSLSGGRHVHNHT